MAIIQDDSEQKRDNEIQSEILDRLYMLELQIDQLALEMQSSHLETLLQNRRMDNIIDTQKEMESRRLCWQEKLSFKDHRIQSDTVWRGSVSHAFAAMTKDLIVDEHVYLGTTYDPERRLKEHVRKTMRSWVVRSENEPDILCKDDGLQMRTIKTLQSNYRMDILYHTTCSGKAAEMESRLLWKYPLTRNILAHANGIVFGKPSYFVYLLKHLRRL